MRLLVLTLAAALSLAACKGTPPVSSATPGAIVEDGPAAVRAANKAYEKALLDGDAAGLNRVLTDDFRFIGWEGEIMDRAAFVEGATRGRDMTTSSSREVVIRQLAPTVVQVTGVWEGDTVEDGQTDHSVERFSNVWVRSAVGWRIELEHTSPLRPAA